MMNPVLPDPQIFVKRYREKKGVFRVFFSCGLRGLTRITLFLNLWLIEPVFNKMQKNGEKLRFFPRKLKQYGW
jgi:hypothetical protein